MGNERFDFELKGFNHIIRTIDCTGCKAVIVNEDNMPRVKFIELNGFYHVAICEKLNGMFVIFVRVNGEWVDFNVSRKVYDIISDIYNKNFQ